MTTQTLPPKTRVGSYVIDRPLSEIGGMAQLFLATHYTDPHLKVALKIQRSGHAQSAIFADLMDREIELLQKLRHPGIVRIYPLAIDGRLVYRAKAHELPHQPWYFAMEYLPGRTLDTYIKQIAQMPLPWIIELFYQILTIVDYLHRNQCAHCDLKPQNIFLRHPPRPDHAPQPILIDFGTGTLPNESGVHLAGSLRYSPSEVLLALQRQDPALRQQIIPPKVDIWALGAILFELIAGRPLANATLRNGITTTIIRGEFDQLTDIKPHTDLDSLQKLDKILAQMLKPNPTQRPSTSMLIRALEEKVPSLRPPRIPHPRP